MYSDQAIGNNIRALRVHKGYSQDYLALKLKISQNAYSKLELGYVRFKLETILTITEILEVDITNLIASNKDCINLIKDNVSLNK